MLKRLRASLKQLLFVRKQYFTLARNEITAINLNTMFVGCIAGLFFVAFFFIISPYIVEGWSVTTEYIMLLPTFSAFAIFAFVYKKKKNVSYKVVQTVCALAYACLLMCFIAISVFPYPDDPETFVSLFIMLMSVLFIVRPVVVLSISVVLGGLFIVLTVLTRNEICIGHDVFSTIAAIAFSQLVSVFVYRLRIADYFSREKLVSLSNSDPLTGVLNKIACESACDTYISSAYNVGFAVLIIDVDNFKSVNDVHGHQMGDNLLVLVSDTLTCVVRSTDVVGRIGGDEFCVLLKNVPDKSVAEEKARRIIADIKRRSVDEYGVEMTCSVGVTMNVEGVMTFKEYYVAADKALYNAKETGKSRFVIVEPVGKCDEVM